MQTPKALGVQVFSAALWSSENHLRGLWQIQAFLEMFFGEAGRGWGRCLKSYRKPNSRFPPWVLYLFEKVSKLRASDQDWASFCFSSSTDLFSPPSSYQRVSNL